MDGGGSELKLNISGIQHFSTGDGPGIRTTVFFKQCNLRCPWCHNPENLSAEPVTLKYANLDETRVCGTYTEISKIASEIVEDKVYYGLENDAPASAHGSGPRGGNASVEVSCGGATLSGGEPLLQSAGALALVKLLEAEGIPTVIDTAGNVPWTAFAPLLGHVQAFYFDYKSGSSAIYRDVIGGDRELIMGNLKKLITAGENVHVRIPLIPGVNTSPEAAAELVSQLKEAHAVKVDLLPFHRLGSAKYAAMGLDYKYKDVPPLQPDTVNELQKLFSAHFDCHVE